MKNRSSAGALADISRGEGRLLERSVLCLLGETEGERKRVGGGRDLRRTHSGLGASAGQSEQVVIVAVGCDFVAAVGVLCVGQEGILEPGDEFALESRERFVSINSIRNTARTERSQQKNDEKKGGKEIRKRTSWLVFKRPISATTISPILYWLASETYSLICASIIS